MPKIYFFLRQIHTLGLAYRAMDLTKIIKSGPSRVRLSSIGIKDLLAGSQEDMQNLNRSFLFYFFQILNLILFRYQQEDLINLGHVLLSIASNMLSLPHNTDSIGNDSPTYFNLNILTKEKRSTLSKRTLARICIK